MSAHWSRTRERSGSCEWRDCWRAATSTRSSLRCGAWSVPMTGFSVAVRRTRGARGFRVSRRPGGGDLSASRSFIPASGSRTSARCTVRRARFTREQRALARKQRGSRRRHKQVAWVARCSSEGRAGWARPSAQADYEARRAVPVHRRQGPQGHGDECQRQRDDRCARSGVSGRRQGSTAGSATPTGASSSDCWSTSSRPRAAGWCVSMPGAQARSARAATPGFPRRSASVGTSARTAGSSCTATTTRPSKLTTGRGQCPSPRQRKTCSARRSR